MGPKSMSVHAHSHGAQISDSGRKVLASGSKRGTRLQNVPGDLQNVPGDLLPSNTLAVLSLEMFLGPNIRKLVHFWLGSCCAGRWFGLAAGSLLQPALKLKSSPTAG